MDCEHEFVTIEYTSKPYGHCLSCDTIVIKNENSEWISLSNILELQSILD